MDWLSVLELGQPTWGTRGCGIRPLRSGVNGLTGLVGWTGWEGLEGWTARLSSTAGYPSGFKFGSAVLRTDDSRPREINKIERGAIAVFCFAGVSVKSFACVSVKPLADVFRVLCRRASL